jgi:hypothetical protein
LLHDRGSYVDKKDTLSFEGANNILFSNLHWLVHRGHGLGQWRIETVAPLRRSNQKFPDWVDNEINNNKHSLRSNTKGYGGKTH